MALAWGLMLGRFVQPLRCLRVVLRFGQVESSEAFRWVAGWHPVVYGSSSLPLQAPRVSLLVANFEA